MTTTQFTALEFEIIMHRFDVPDCILEALQADYDVSDDDFWEQLPDINEKTRSITVSSELSKQILVEALEGSAYLRCSEDTVSDQKYAAIQRAHEQAGDKIAAMAAE